MKPLGNKVTGTSINKQVMGGDRLIIDGNSFFKRQNKHITLGNM